MRTFQRTLPAFALVAAFPAAASADVITEWNVIAIDAARSFANPNPATRAVAIGHLAAYDAVNAINHSGEPYLPGPLAVTAPASVEAAAITAFHDALVFAVPAKQAELDAAEQTALGKIADGPAKTNGVAVGAAAAAALVTNRAGDGAEAVVAYPGEDALGKWRPTPTGNLAANTPQWATLKPFALSAADQFDPGPPPALTSGTYTTALLETKIYGALTGSVRTDEQTNIAKFWAQQTHLPFYLIARFFAAARDLSVDDNARFFAQLSLALADSRVAVWNAKYEYGFWRPITSINSALDDGNPDTHPDPEGDWAPLLETPNHPEYVSGHSATGAAGAAVLAHWFGDTNSFTVTSETLPGPAFARHFSRFSDAAQENADSRIYGGIHYRFSNEAGLELGEAVAGYVLTHRLQAFPPQGDGDGDGDGDGGAAGASGASSDGEAGAGSANEAGASAGGTSNAGSGGTGSGATAGALTGGTGGAASSGTTTGGKAPASAGADGEGGGSEGGSSTHSGDYEDGGCSVAAPGARTAASSAILSLLAAWALLRRRR